MNKNGAKTAVFTPFSGELASKKAEPIKWLNIINSQIVVMPKPKSKFGISRR